VITNVITEADKAWMAAVVDVKGAVARKVSRSRRTPQVVLTVRVKDARIARRLGALTGVTPEVRESPKVSEFLRRGCAEHCAEAHIHIGSVYPWRMPEVTHWTLTGAAAAVVLSNLAPHMCTYGDYQADVAAITENLVTTGRGSGMVRASVERLRELGWAVPPALEVRVAALAAVTE
jgi:hypothetical protein